MDRKYSLLVISFIITIGLFWLVIGLLEANKYSFKPLVPAQYFEFIGILPGTIFTDILLLLAIPVGAFGLIYAVTPLFSKVLVYIHKLIMRGAKYGFAQLGAEIKAGSFLRRAFMVSLVAFNLSAILVGLGYGEYFRVDMATPDANMMTLHEAEAVFLGTFLLAAAGLVVFMPLWILEDSGLMMYRIFPDQRRAPDIEGVHSMYANIVKAYISISILYTLWEYITKAFAATTIDNPAILTPIILCVLPFLTIGLVSIPVFLYEKYLPRFKNRVASGLQRFNLPDIQIPDIRQIGVDKITVE